MSVRTIGRAVAALFAVACVVPLAFLSVSAASALDQPKTPQPVSDYFADGLVPRLIDLYGSGDGLTNGSGFDETTVIGTISRVREWTPDFLIGRVSVEPTRLTNDWVAPVSVHGSVLGLATVWINPADDEPELASFDSSDVARKIGLAPEGSWLIHDPARQAWFAMTDAGLTPLVPGTSGVTELIVPGAYQRLIVGVAPEKPTSPTGVTVAALVLGIVILGVAVFVLLPVKRRDPEVLPREGIEEPPREPPVLAPPASAKNPAAANPVIAKKSAAAKFPAAKPVTAKPAAAKPAAAKSPSAKPAAAKPAAAKPPVAKPATAKPAAAKPPVAKPATAKPAAAKPAATKLEGGKPASTKQGARKRAATTQASPAPKTTKPGASSAATH